MFTYLLAWPCFYNKNLKYTSLVTESGFNLKAKQFAKYSLHTFCYVLNRHTHIQLHQDLFFTVVQQHNHHLT